MAQPNDAAPPPPSEVIRSTPTHGGRYIQYRVNGHLFEVTAKYRPPVIQEGSGAYGIVCSLLNSETNQRVAIKKISHAFDRSDDAKKTLREINILSHLKHENIIAIRDIIPPPRRERFEDVYVVYELMETDLQRVIQSHLVLSDDQIVHIMYQILRGLKYIHSANVLHRDLKPSNILVNKSCEVKICDFGLARVASQTGFMTEYVVTRWYRSPELLLSSSSPYDSSIDVWSVGCIFMELLTRAPSFPARDYTQQFRMIFELLGTPSEDEMSHLHSGAQAYIRHVPRYPKQSLTDKFPTLNPVAMDLVGKMLAFDARTRITAVDALAHPYFGVLHDVSDEPVCATPFAFDVEQFGLNREQTKEFVYHDSLRYNPNHQR